MARYNVPLGVNGPMMPNSLSVDHYEEILLITDSIPDFRAHLEANSTTPWIRGVPLPKVMARPECIGGLPDGMHDILPTGNAQLRRAVPRDLIIAHVPFTTKERFTRKMRNMRRNIAIHNEYLGSGIAWHWRRWVELDDEGRFDEEFDRTIFNAATVERFRSERVICSAAELFAD